MSFFSISMASAILLVVALFVLTGASARADERPADNGAIAIVSYVECCPQEAWPEVERALQDELELIDIPVLIVPKEQQNAATNAAAMIRIYRSSPSPGPGANVEIWIEDRITGKTTRRSISVKDTRSSHEATVVALRTVDALRASLLELRMTGDSLVASTPSVSENSGDPNPPESIEQLVMETNIEGSKSKRSIAIGVGVDGLYSPGGAGVRGGFSLHAMWQPIPVGGLMLDFLYAPLGSDVTSNGVSTSVQLLIVRGYLRLNLLKYNRITPYLAAGGGGVVVMAEGTSADTSRVGYLSGIVGLDVNLGERFKLGGAFNAGVFLPEVKLYHWEDQAASMGRPLLELLLTFAVRLP